MASILFPLSAPHFIATKTEEEIAQRLREDEKLIRDGKLCSWVAWHLPKYDSPKGRAIAAFLAPLPNLSHDLKSVVYENLLRYIRHYLRQGKADPWQQAQKASKLLQPSDFRTALTVLEHLKDAGEIYQNWSTDRIMACLRKRIDSPAPETPPCLDDLYATASENIPKPPPLPRKRLCYICRLALVNPHPSQPSMCIPCGAFNLASSQLSLPPKFSLPSTFTALVTGARINLGYHTTLRLLRCGARVIATTRYPRDAVARYLAESDSAAWRERLKIVGADFRCAADAFALAEETKRCLSAWADGGEVKLHALINNAAQTLTDSVKKEQHAMKREAVLAKEMKNQTLLIEGTYRVRVRGEALPKALESTHEHLEGNAADANADAAAAAKMVELLHAPNGSPSAEPEPYTKSSWVQSLFDIPYADVISAHAVNTFVPLILCRELLPLMGCNSHSPSTGLPPKPGPHGYIINVSSREGIFEDRTNSTAKRGHHVHTNMSKAALNMITETEAATAWQSRRVAMNTVDPGYMSAAPEYEDAFEGVRPIEWEDGAGRVLWPVAVGEMEGLVVRGRFLKHYGAVPVDPGAGRG